MERENREKDRGGRREGQKKVVRETQRDRDREREGGSLALQSAVVSVLVSGLSLSLPVKAGRPTLLWRANLGGVAGLMILQAVWSTLFCTAEADASPRPVA